MNRCDVDPSRVAVWWSDKLCLRLSGAVASLLDQQGLIDMRDLEMLSERNYTRGIIQRCADISPGSKEYEVMKHHGDPLIGTWQGVAHILTTAVEGTAKLFYNPVSLLPLAASFVGLQSEADMIAASRGYGAYMGSIRRQLGRRL